VGSRAFAAIDFDSLPAPHFGAKQRLMSKMSQPPSFRQGCRNPGHGWSLTGYEKPDKNRPLCVLYWQKKDGVQRFLWPG
jgi:hypothetical protein